MRPCIRIAALLGATLCMGLPLQGQEGVMKVHPAGPSDGKVLTMEDAILSRDVHPRARIEMRKVVRPLSDKGFDFGRRPSPRAFSKGGELFYVKDSGDTICIAARENDQIVYGETVSRNEFGIDGGIFPSPDGQKIAFYRKDESKVTDFPLLDISTRTGSLRSIKYPMNGMESERITLGIYDIPSGKTVWADVTDFGEDRYLTNISWGPDSRNIFIQVLDRSQKHMRLNMYRSCDGSFAMTILTEDDSRYVEPLDPLHFIGDAYHFIYRTNNRDGYRNLYLCDTLGCVKRITNVDADVEFTAIKGNTIFYHSAEISPVQRHFFRVDITPARGRRAESAANSRIGTPRRLTFEEGWHDATLNSDGSLFVDYYSSFNVPGNIVLCSSTDGKVSETLLQSEDPLSGYSTGEVLFGSVRSADGKYDNYYRLYKPKDFDPAKKYPVVVYVYGGPHSQMVTDSWLGQIRMWEELMAQKGYVVYVQDNRGTQNRGKDFEQAIHRQCGKAEMEDQMVGVDMLKSLPWVDSERIGVHGWSYGGFMTISLMTTYPETFKVGVAGGPVIDWKWYEIMYGERYMETEKTNPDGFSSTSLINKAGDLKGKLLICQGAIDNTVVWEHSLSFVQKCIEQNIQLDYFPYPRSEHNVFGRWRVHLMDKVTDYFEQYL